MAVKKGSAIEISTGTLLKIILLGLGLVVLYLVRDIIVILLLSVVIASGIEPAVRYISREFRMPRALSVLFIYIFGLCLVALIFYLFIPPLLGDLRTFASNFPVAIDSILSEFRLLLYDPATKVQNPLLPSSEELSGRINHFLNNQLASFFTFGAAAGSTILGGAISFILTIVLSFYLSVQENGILNFLRLVTPHEHEAYVVNLWARSQRKIGKWLQGQILLALLVGVLVFIGLTILDVRYALALSILAATFEIIPVFGPILAAIPSVIVAFIQSPTLGLWVILLYVIVQQVENHIIYPLVVRKAIGVPPLLVILALLIGGKLGGLPGFILAVPIAATIMEFTNDVAERKQLFGRVS